MVQFQVPMRDLRMTYIPAFQTCVEAGVYSIGCTYTRSVVATNLIYIAAVLYAISSLQLKWRAHMHRQADINWYCQKGMGFLWVCLFWCWFHDRSYQPGEKHKAENFLVLEFRIYFKMNWIKLRCTCDMSTVSRGQYKCRSGSTWNLCWLQSRTWQHHLPWHCQSRQPKAHHWWAYSIYKHFVISKQLIGLFSYSEQEVRENIKPLLYARMRHGEFDPPDMVPYEKIPMSVIQSQEHQKLAIVAAAKSFVLLKNDGLLPLRKTYNKLAVSGILVKHCWQHVHSFPWNLCVAADCRTNGKWPGTALWWLPVRCGVDASFRQHPVAGSAGTRYLCLLGHRVQWPPLYQLQLQGDISHCDWGRPSCHLSGVW